MIEWLEGDLGDWWVPRLGWWVLVWWDHDAPGGEFTQDPGLGPTQLGLSSSGGPYWTISWDRHTSITITTIWVPRLGYMIPI